MSPDTSGLRGFIGREEEQPIDKNPKREQPNSDDRLHPDPEQSRRYSEYTDPGHGNTDTRR